MNRQHAPWRIALGTFALALAVLVSGLAASPAQAKSGREVAVETANALVAECVASGGDPEVESNEANGQIWVTCVYDDHAEGCTLYHAGDMYFGSCHNAFVVQPPESPWGQIGTTEGSELMGGETEPSAPLTASPTVAGTQPGVAPLDDHDQDQDKGKKNKKHKKGKKGGKGRKK